MLLARQDAIDGLFRQLGARPRALITSDEVVADPSQSEFNRSNEGCCWASLTMKHSLDKQADENSTIGSDLYFKLDSRARRFGAVSFYLPSVCSI